jgi:transcriptional regulator with XRE-family HTH domain
MLKRDIELSRLFREARHARAMTQSELAAKSGVKQSAVSMYECGRTDVVSKKNVLAMAEVLGIDPVRVESIQSRSAEFERPALKYCPIDSCPSNVPFVVRGEVHYKPTMTEGRAGEKMHCRYCGEFLEEQCPKSECRKPVAEGAACVHCGEFYVTTTCEFEGAPDARVAELRRQIVELDERTRTKRMGSLPS